ncbi:unnamed protein product, partial [Rotaria sp. Silwood2]
MGNRGGRRPPPYPVPPAITYSPGQFYPPGGHRPGCHG